MAGVESRDFDAPDERRTPDKTQVDVVRMGATTAGRFAFEPGWRWSDCVKPVAGTGSCQARHVGVVHSGRLGATGARNWLSRAWLAGISPLAVFRTGHVPDDGVDVGALGLDFVDVDTAPRDAL